MRRKLPLQLLQTRQPNQYSRFVICPTHQAMSLPDTLRGSDQLWRTGTSGMPEMSAVFACSLENKRECLQMAELADLFT